MYIWEGEKVPFLYEINTAHVNIWTFQLNCMKVSLSQCHLWACQFNAILTWLQMTRRRGITRLQCGWSDADIEIIAFPHVVLQLCDGTHTFRVSELPASPTPPPRPRRAAPLSSMEDDLLLGDPPSLDLRYGDSEGPRVPTRPCNRFPHTTAVQVVLGRIPPALPSTLHTWLWSFPLRSWRTLYFEVVSPEFLHETLNSKDSVGRLRWRTGFLRGERDAVSPAGGRGAVKVSLITRPKLTCSAPCREGKVRLSDSKRLSLKKKRNTCRRGLCNSSVP